MLDAAGGAPARRHPHRHRAVVVAPVGPVTRQLARLEALVGVHGRGAQGREPFVMGQHPGDGVLRHVRQAVVAARVVELVPPAVAGDAEMEVGAVAAPVLEGAPQERQQQAVAQRHLPAELLQQEGAVQGVEGVAVAHHQLELRVVVLAAHRLDAEAAALGGRHDVVEQPHRVDDRAGAVAVGPRRVPGLPAAGPVGLQHVRLQFHADLGRAAGGGGERIDGAAGGEAAGDGERAALALQVGDHDAGALVPAGAHRVHRVERSEVAHALQHLGPGRRDEVAVVADAEDRHREPHLAGHGGGRHVLAASEAELVGEQNPDAVHSFWQHLSIRPSAGGLVTP